MKLFQEIKKNTTDSSKDLADILRKTKIVASLLKNPELKEWVNRELNGYYGIDKEEIPKFRIAAGQNLGHFSGPWGSGLRNANIPLSRLPDFIKEFASKLYFRESVGELQSLAKSDSDTFQAKWPADIIPYIQHNIQIYEDMHLVDAWQVMTKPQVNSILDTVRTRLLDFILELEESFPELVGSEQDLGKIPESAVTNHFHTHISGNKNIVNTGSNINQNIDKIVIEDDLRSLNNYLSSLGIPEYDLQDLEKAIKNDEKPEKKENFGSRVSSWLGKITEKAVSGSVELASKEGTSAIIKAISTYYGFR